MSRAAVEHAATFSWAHTDALLASYGRAITDYAVRHHSGAAVAPQRRRFSMRRGVRAEQR